MKTLKTTLTTTKYLLLALLVAFTFSCDAEDGMDGAPGEQGFSGVNGQDGNANVHNFSFDISAITGTSLIELSLQEVTQDVMDEDVVLTYLYDEGTNTYISVPGVGLVNDHFLDAEITVGLISVNIWDTNISNPLNYSGDYEGAKVIIIESSSSSNSSRMSQPTDIYSELENSNIDVNNYYAVCDYLGIKY